MMDYVLASWYAWQGEPVRRAVWPQGVYVCLKGASLHLFAPKQAATVWHYSREDFKAEDYEKYHTGLCRSNRTDEIRATGNSEGLDSQPNHDNPAVSQPNDSA